ncbi:hypothetical protein G6L92_18445 [Agrobacterium rhizogenes]|nr:hypothetical protein [Rhizobium rhizogenes]
MVKLADIQRTRVAVFKQQAKQFSESAALRDFVEQLKQRLDQTGQEDGRANVQNWIDWAERAIEELDPLSKGLPTLMSAEKACSNSWRYRDQ